MTLAGLVPAGNPESFTTSKELNGEGLGESCLVRSSVDSSISSSVRYSFVAKPPDEGVLQPISLRNGESATLHDLFASQWVADLFVERYKIDVARGDRSGGLFFTFNAAIKREGKKPLRLDLAEYFALQVSGRREKFKDSTRALWRLRALVELGQVDLPDLGMVVPGDAPTEAIRKGLDGIALLFAHRWPLWPGVPAVLARPFLSSWSGGISEYEARQAVVYARDSDPPLVRLLTQGRVGGRLANLYVPAVAT